MGANLLITFDPAHSGKAKDEVNTMLKEAGGDGEFVESSVEGLFLLKVKDAKKVTKKLKTVCEKEPSKFEFTFRWAPIDSWCSSDMKALSGEMKKLDGKMKDEESWKLDLGKRQYDGKTTDLILKLTENINKPKVDLKNPQKIIKVEIIGDKAGIALLDANEVLDTSKIKGK